MSVWKKFLSGKWNAWELVLDDDTCATAERITNHHLLLEDVVAQQESEKKAHTINSPLPNPIYRREWNEHAEGAGR